MVNVAIVGNGPSDLLPELHDYRNEIDIWIGADRGALTLINHGIDVDYALGDFDSITQHENDRIKARAKTYLQYPSEKDYTDIELALIKAFELNPSQIYLFAVTGGRLDHGLVNIQLLHSVLKRQIRGMIVDKYNKIELTDPGRYSIEHDDDYPYISFIPFSQHVKCLTLTGFYYPLEKADISWGPLFVYQTSFFQIKVLFIMKVAYYY